MITVITRTQFKPSLIGIMEDLTNRSIPIFQAQKGFISMDIKKDSNDEGTLTIFQWRTKEDHENCMKSGDWDTINPEWEAFLNREDVTFDFLFIGSDWKYIKA